MIAPVTEEILRIATGELDARGTVNKTALTEMGFVVGASAKPKAVSAQARLQVSASAVWFGVVDTSLDSAGASRKKQQNIKQRPGHQPQLTESPART